MEKFLKAKLRFYKDGARNIDWVIQYDYGPMRGCRFLYRTGVSFEWYSCQNKKFFKRMMKWQSN